MDTPQYVDDKGVGFSIHRSQDGSWQVWQLPNKKLGWCWVATLRSYSLAHSFMAWFGSFDDKDK